MGTTSAVKFMKVDEVNCRNTMEQKFVIGSLTLFLLGDGFSELPYPTPPHLSSPLLIFLKYPLNGRDFHLKFCDFS